MQAGDTTVFDPHDLTDDKVHRAARRRDGAGWRLERPGVRTARRELADHLVVGRHLVGDADSDVRKRALEALHKAGEAVAAVEGLTEWNQDGFDILRHQLQGVVELIVAEQLIDPARQRGVLNSRHSGVLLSGAILQPSAEFFCSMAPVYQERIETRWAEMRRFAC